MAVRLEHANLTVRDIEGMIRFLQAALPEFKVRTKASVRTAADGYILAPRKPTLP